MQTYAVFDAITNEQLSDITSKCRAIVWQGEYLIEGRAVTIKPATGVTQ